MGSRKYNETLWTVIEVLFEVTADPGGWVPNWIVNFSVKYVPYFTCKSIREMLHEVHERYKGVSYDYIKEATLQ